MLGVGGTFLGGLVDRLLSGGTGWLFGLAFLSATVLVALKIRARDSAAAVITPPIAFALTVAVLSAFFGTDGGWVSRVGIDLLRALTFKAGLLWGGTALAAAIVVVRRRTAARPS